MSGEDDEYATDGADLLNRQEYPADGALADGEEEFIKTGGRGSTGFGKSQRLDRTATETDETAMAFNEAKMSARR